MKGIIIIVIIPSYNLYANCDKQKQVWRKYIKRYGGNPSTVKQTKESQCQVKRTFPTSVI